MSSYRDDTQETAVTSDSTWGRMKTIAEEVVKISSSLLFTLTIVHLEVAHAAVSISDARYQVVYEVAALSDQILERNKTTHQIHERASIRATDQSYARIRDVNIEHATLQDSYADRSKTVFAENAMLNDTVIDKKFTQSQITERIRLQDKLQSFAIQKSLIGEVAHLHEGIQSNLMIMNMDSSKIVDEVIDRGVCSLFLSESLKIQDSIIQVFRDHCTDELKLSEHLSTQLVRSEWIKESLSIADELKHNQNFQEILVDIAYLKSGYQDHVHAQSLIQDVLFIEDHFIGDQLVVGGAAWTANADNWAMSRYQDYGFSELAVINGVLYGVTEDGVYQLDAKERVEGRLVTGQLDLGQGQLVHPLGAYLEYELSGNSRNLEIGVSATQSGSKQTYYYLLPTEKSDHLTNGRVLFGRGLRGRHFSFELKMSGEHGYINDLSIDVAATKRRV